MKYTINIMDLVDRELIKNTHPFEFQNKMTDDEYEQFEKEMLLFLKESGLKESSDEWCAKRIAETIDIDIIYNCFILGR
jgi:hypothetical protein